jgi:hypothetical protein
MSLNYLKTHINQSKSRIIHSSWKNQIPHYKAITEEIYQPSYIVEETTYSFTDQDQMA